MAGREPEPLGASRPGFPKADFIELVSETAIALQKALAEFLQRTNLPIWLNAKRCFEPYRGSLRQITDTMNSLIKLGGTNQFVASSHAEVTAAIKAAGDDFQPLPVARRSSLSSTC
jgi:hypothetical protein